MLNLWIGVMAGVLLAYLWTRATASPFSPPWWKSPRPWLALIGVVGATLLLLPVGADFWGVGSTRSGWISALKLIVLPWLAGFGFGGWIYYTLVRDPALSKGDPQEANGQPEPSSREAVAVSRREATGISWVPAAVALLLVTVIFSEERYGWLARLQKFTFPGGGGVELAPSAVAGTAVTADRAPSELLGTTAGEGRIDLLLQTMSSLAQFVERDQVFAEEANLGPKDNPIYTADLEFSKKVVAPLGQHLRKIHGVRSYNDIGFLVDRQFVHDFRAFTQGYMFPMGPGQEQADAHPLPTPPSHGPRQRIAANLKQVWQATCMAEEQLIRGKHLVVETSGGGDCRSDRKAAEDFLDAATSWAAIERFGFDPGLPYGTLLSSMLLYAAGEVNPAVQDLDRWVATYPPQDGEAFRRFGIYRALILSASLLASENPTGERAHRLMKKYDEAIENGNWLLMRTGNGRVDQASWSAQIAKLTESRGNVSLSGRTGCEQELTDNFKRLMIANLILYNNLAFYLSENMDFAESQRLVGDMKIYSEYIAKVDTTCLRPRRWVSKSESDDPAISTRATFLDTAAKVELELALVEKSREKKKDLLCDALQYAKEAVDADKLLDVSARSRRGPSLSSDVLSSEEAKAVLAYGDPLPARVVLDRLSREREQERAVATTLLLQGRLRLVERHLEREAITC